MSEGEEIICRPTKWFLWRAFAMVVMFVFFTGWFLRDWKVGYPMKNRVYYEFLAFKEAKGLFQEHEESGQTAEEWSQVVSAKTLGELVIAEANEKKQGGKGEEPGEVEEPPGISMDDPWPAVLADHAAYRKAYEEEKEKVAPPGWKAYSNERRWSSSPPKGGNSVTKVRNQLIYAVVAGVGALVALVMTVRTMRRSLRVDGEALHAPAGQVVPFKAIHRIDKRKWDTKGLATIYYTEGGTEKKLKVDGMVYGQFREEDGAPAERLFEQILANFSGELLELEEAGEEAAGEGAEQPEEGS